MPSSSAQATPVPVCGLVLAAGLATRFGSDKLLHPLPDGRPLIAHTLAAVGEALGTQFLVVTGEDNRSLRESLASLRIRTVLTGDQPASLGTSLAAGVAAIPADHGFAVMLADLPFIAPATIAAVARAIAGGAGIAAPFHAGQRGHPVGFAPAWRQALLGLHGQPGAGSLVAGCGSDLLRIEVDDPGCITDIDTPADLAAALATRGQRTPPPKSG